MVLSVLYMLACRLLALVVLLEILVLRHELSVVRRRAGRPRYSPRDRLLLASLSRVMPRHCWPAFVVTPETLLAWHRRLVAGHWTYPHRRPGRPRIDRDVRALIVRLARENADWGYVRIARGLRKLGIDVSPTLVRNVLQAAGIPPAPRRRGTTWRSFLRQHAAIALSCDFFTVDTVLLRRLYVLVFIRLGSRRVEYVACTGNPDKPWVAQQARNLLMDLDDRGQRTRFLIHDRDAKFSRAFDLIFESEGTRIVRTPIQAPNANAHIERRIGTARRECLDRLLVFTRRQLEHVLRVFVRHYNERRPHRALDLRAPALTTLPSTRGDPCSSTAVRRRDLLGELIHEYEPLAA